MVINVIGICVDEEGEQVKLALLLTTVIALGKKLLSLFAQVLSDLYHQPRQKQFKRMISGVGGVFDDL